MQKVINLFIGGSIDKLMSNNYLEIAQELGSIINERDYRIVFDGCAGLASVVFENINRPKSAHILHTRYYGSNYIDNYYSHGSFKINSVFELENQSKMTDAVIEDSDALIFMKGQTWTLEELLRVINGNKNNEYNKPVVILNVNNEWDDLVNLLSSCMVDEYYYVTDNVMDAFNYIEKKLFEKTSSYYKNYVYTRHAERQYPIIEEVKKLSK